MRTPPPVRLSRIDARPTSSVIVFSKDRPLQLDATLSSLELNLAAGETAEIHVLYRASTPRFAAAYRVLAGQHPSTMLQAEADFKKDLLGLLAGSEHVLFLVDDTVFVGGFSLATAIDALTNEQSLIGFSYRLGRNTTYCYTLDKPQSLPVFDRQAAGVLAFDWTAAEHDFGYPLEVSSSLYRTADVLPVIEELGFRDPNTLEAGLARHASAFRTTRPRLACYEQSVAVSVPANIVQTAWANRVDGRAELAPEVLLARYETGERIDVAGHRRHVSNACHQELEYRFVRDPSIPTVSVVIPCYDQARFLPDAVGSVVAQTFTDWEIVIVDDGSPDDTAAVASRLAADIGDRVRLIRQANGGLAAARNAGVRAARGRYILPLDADDMIEPTMLEKTTALLEENPAVSIAYTDLQQFGGGDDLIHASDFDASRLPEANHLSYCSLYRVEVWDSVGGYNPNMTWGYEDWDFWVGAAERGYVARRLAEPLFLYRIRTDTMYSTALRHDTELRRQIQQNHPATYRTSRRIRRWLMIRCRPLRERLGRRLRRSRLTALKRGQWGGLG